MKKLRFSLTHEIMNLDPPILTDLTISGDVLNTFDSIFSLIYFTFVPFKRCCLLHLCSALLFLEQQMLGVNDC